MLNVEVRRDGALVIHPPITEMAESDKVSVTYSKGQMAALKDMILGAYLLGYNIIEISSRDGEIDPKDREEIRGIIHSFIGLEVLDEAELILFMAGNQFMVMDELIQAFKEETGIEKIFYETLPPRLMLRQILAGGAKFRDVILPGTPDIYSSVSEDSMGGAYSGTQSK